MSVARKQARTDRRIALSLRRSAAVFALGLPLLSAAAYAQTKPTWTVQPQWVRAHEEFLAADALGGRGSATRDEAITAAYVASEFISYGLDKAPGLPTYLQTAEIFQPKLDGHASLTIGGVTLTEGAGFSLLSAAGTNAVGATTAVVSDPKLIQPKTAVVLAKPTADAPGNRWSQAASHAGAKLLLIEEDASLTRAVTQQNGVPRIRAVLKDKAAENAGLTVVVLTHEAFAKLAAQPQGTRVALAVHALPEAEPHVTTNAIGYLKGTDPAAGTLLLTAHLDHLGTRAGATGDAIFNGANDDAAGTTAVLELAHAMAAGPRPKRSILFVCYGSEEIGEFGSLYFGEHSPVPLKDLIANLEFEMIGNQDPKMPKGTLLLTGWDRSNLGPELKAHGALLGPDPYPEEHFFERSDNYQLALQGVVAHTAAGWGTPPTYHKADDDLAHLDLPFMTAAIQSLVEPIRWLASSDFKPAWNPGGKPSR